MRVHQLQNIQIALNYIKLRKVKLVNIRPEDIVDGNQKLILGLIWTIILHFQVSKSRVGIGDKVGEEFGGKKEWQTINLVIYLSLALCSAPLDSSSFEVAFSKGSFYFIHSVCSSLDLEVSMKRLRERS